MEMSKEEIRQECSRLFRCKTLQDSYDLINIYLEYLFQVINQHEEEVFSSADKDAKMVNQMMFTKVAHIKRIVEGINFQAKDGKKLGTIIDPTIVASLIRNVYETVSMFHLIYRRSNNKEEKTILYNLWVHAGLKYRQRFEVVITTTENREKLENEQKQIEQLEEEIKNTNVFQNLTERDKKKILTKLEKKDFKIWLNNNKVELIDWQGITHIMGLKNDLLDNIYTYFSLYSHPSNVAVFQFSEMFEVGEEAFIKITNNNLNYLFILLSIYVADYINLFPSVIEIFNNLSIRDQVIINFHNITMRKDEYSINDAWKKL
jgi:hypothetical protein